MTQDSPWGAQLESALIALITELHEHGESAGNQPLKIWQGWLEAEGYDATNLESFFLDPELLGYWQGEPSLPETFASAIKDGQSTEEFLNRLAEQQPTYLNNTIEAADQLVTQQRQLMTTAGGTQATKGLLGKTGMSKGGADSIRAIGGAVALAAIGGALYYKFRKGNEIERVPSRIEDRDVGRAINEISDPSRLSPRDFEDIDRVLKDHIGELKVNKMNAIKRASDEENKSAENKFNELDKFAKDGWANDSMIKHEYLRSNHSWEAQRNIEKLPKNDPEKYAKATKAIEDQARRDFVDSKFKKLSFDHNNNWTKASEDISRDFDRQIQETAELIEKNEANKLASLGEEEIKVLGDEAEQAAQKRLSEVADDLEAKMETKEENMLADFEF